MRRFLFTAVVVMGAALAGSAIAPVAQAASTGLTAAQTGQIVSDGAGEDDPEHPGRHRLLASPRWATRSSSAAASPRCRTPAAPPRLTRNHLFAFDATTGEVSTTFAPDPNGVVYKVQAAADGSSVYVGGLFTGMAGGNARQPLRGRRDHRRPDARLRSLHPGRTGPRHRGRRQPAVDRRASSRTSARIAQKALGTLNATTGLLRPLLHRRARGRHHNPAVPGATTCSQISDQPGQHARWSRSATSRPSTAQSPRPDRASSTSAAPAAPLSPWNTTLFTQACSSKFDTNMTDVEYSPNGGYFVVSTTGAYGGTAAPAAPSAATCVARFEDGVASASQPTWTAYTGGDTTWTVEVTDNVVYAGGHKRWQNNPTARRPGRPGRGQP